MKLVIICITRLHSSVFGKVNELVGEIKYAFEGGWMYMYVGECFIMEIMTMIPSHLTPTDSSLILAFGIRNTGFLTLSFDSLYIYL